MIKKILFVFVMIGFTFFLHPQKGPDEFFGLTVGADRTLVNYPDIIRYFNYLDGESDRIQMVKEGRSTRGNHMYTAFISSADNLGRLKTFFDINKKLSNPDRIDVEEARRLIGQTKVMVLVTCGIHATEVGAAQAAMVFAHQLATTADPAVKAYLDDVVILLMPSINPDGGIMISEWYEKYVGTQYEGGRMPWLYHPYAGHDNNRDFYMLNLAESRVVNAVLHHRYFPQLYLDMHQMGSTGARMFVPPFKDPFNSNLDPVMIQETNLIGTMMALRLQEAGKKGVGTSYTFDAYWPGGSKNTAWYKNVVGILTELASVRIASPIYIEPNELRTGAKGLPEYKAQVNFPDPWPGGWWRLKDIVDYEVIALHALLETCSKNKESFLFNFYKMAKDNIDGSFGANPGANSDDAPYAYVVPPDQWDAPAAVTFLQKMAEHGVRIYRSTEEIRDNNRVFPAGSYLIPLAQPYRDFVKVMMERQRYPEIKHVKDGPIIEPYDATGWTMPLQMGVKTAEIACAPENPKLEPVTDIPYPRETITGDGAYYLVPGRFNRSAIAVNRLHKKNITVSRYASVYVPSDAAELRIGDFLVKTSDINETAMLNILKGTGLAITRTNAAAADVKALRPPRIGIYQSYLASMDEGWTRWVMDHFEFPYTILRNKDFTTKKLAAYNLLLFPDMNREIIVKGVSRSRWARYSPKSPPPYTGGIGEKGLEALKQFVRKGGTAVLMDSASELGTEDFSLPFFNVLKDRSTREFSCPGSLLAIKVDNEDPIGWGMEADNFIYFSRSPAFRTRVPYEPNTGRKVVARFKEKGNHLLSGYLKGGKYLDRTVMIARFDYHKGNVIVLGGRVQHRSQTFGTFKFLFNSIYYAGL